MDVLQRPLKTGFDDDDDDDDDLELPILFRLGSNGGVM